MCTTGYSLAERLFGNVAAPKLDESWAAGNRAAMDGNYRQALEDWSVALGFRER